MAVAHAVLGLLLLAVGAGLIFARRRIGRRHRRGDSWMTAAPIVWLALGLMLAMNGVLQLVLALV